MEEPVQAQDARSSRWVASGAIALAFAAMAALSWGRWPDVLVDFGHELYAPWLLGQGKALSRDVVLFATGPLSPYLNAALFRFFGPGFWVLATFNLAVLAAITALLLALLRALSGAYAATLAALAFLLVFAFGQYVGTGNYNYVAPYSHGVTHGVALSLAAMLLAHRHLRTGDVRALAGAGLLVGLVFLTKPEIFLACSAAVLGALALALRDGAGTRARRAGAFAAAALAAPAGALALLSLQLPVRDALRALAGPWAFVASPFARTPFYLAGLGLDRPAENAAAALRWLACGTALFAGVALLDWRARHRAAGRGAEAAAAAVAFALVAFLVPPEEATNVARPLPLLAGLAAIVYLARAWRAGPGPERRRGALGFMVAAFATGLLAKMPLNARIHHYGFVLAMPGTLLLVCWLTRSLPDAVRRVGGSGALVRGAAAGAIAALALGFVRTSAEVYGHKPVTVSSGVDAFRADWRGGTVNALLEKLASEARGGRTLAVIPEGAMVNYLARRPNPTPFLTYLPDAIAAFGEDAILARYLEDPPDHIVIVQRDASEFGPSLFGRDYALKTMRWIAGNYAPVARVGGSPFERGPYGALLLARIPGR